MLEKMRRILGNDHLDTLISMNNLAETYRAQGRIGDAARIWEEMQKRRRRILGDDDPNMLIIMNNLAGTYRAQDKMSASQDL